MQVDRTRNFWWLRWLAILAGLPLFCGSALAQQTVGGMILPNGQVITGPVFRSDGTFVTSITTGADANLYINSVAPTQSFVNNAPAAVISVLITPSVRARI